MNTSIVSVHSHVCLYRQLRSASYHTTIRHTKDTIFATYGRARDIIFQWDKREKELREKDLFVNMFEIELPVFHLQMNQKDRANITKMILEVAVEIYKKQFPPSTFEFSPHMCTKVHVGGEIQEVVNLLGSVMDSSNAEMRLQSLKVAIRESFQVSVLPLVYLFTMSDAGTGVMNAYPQSVFRYRDRLNPQAINGYTKCGMKEVGSSNANILLKLSNGGGGGRPLTITSCDALSIKDPRILSIQENYPDSYVNPTQCDYMNDSHHIQLTDSSPKWLKSFSVAMLTDIYRSISWDSLQTIQHTPTSMLEDLRSGHPGVRSEVFESTNKTNKTERNPMLYFMSTARNCVDAMEGVASDIVSAHILSQDLIPRPFNFYRYKLPQLYSARSLDEAKEIMSQNSKDNLPPMNCNVNKLLSAQTKKKARLASLLFKSNDASRRLEQPPRSTRNMKEFEEPKSLQRKIEENGEVDVDFLEEVSNIFGAHASPASPLEYIDEVEGLGGVRLETMEPVGPTVGIPTGHSADCGAETGGLPPNDLQNFVRAMCDLKGQKSKKRKLVRRLLSPDALTTVAILVEELATEMVLSWKKRIDAAGGAIDSSGRVPASSCAVATDEGGRKRQRLSPPTEMEGPQSVPPSHPDVTNCSPSSKEALPPLLLCDPEVFLREVRLQVQGVDLDGGVGEAVEEAVRNRMEVLFGPAMVNTPENISAIHSALALELAEQEVEQVEQTRLYQDECNKCGDPMPLKRLKSAL